MFVNIVKLLQLLSKDKCYWRVSCTPVAAAETKLYMIEIQETKMRVLYKNV